MLTRALGSGPAVDPDVRYAELVPGDVLILCTDGLTNHVADDEILAIAGQDAPSRAAQRLVDLANARGGADNITVVIVQAEAEAGLAATALPTWLSAGPAFLSAGRQWLVCRPLWQIIGIIVAAILLLALVIVLLLNRPSSRPPVEILSSLAVWPFVMTCAPARCCAG